MYTISKLVPNTLMSEIVEHIKPLCFHLGQMEK